MKNIEAILQHFANGAAVVRINGDFLRDQHVDDRGVIAPHFLSLVRRVFERLGSPILYFTLATGAQFHWPAHVDDSKREAWFKKLAAAGINRAELQPSDSDTYGDAPLPRLMAIVRRLAPALRKAVGCRLIMMVDFVEDLIGCQAGTQSDANLALSELLIALSHQSVNGSGGLHVLLSGSAMRMDERVSRAVPDVVCSLPDVTEKRAFIAALRSDPEFAGATVEPGLSDDEIARLHAQMPNWGLTVIFRTSARGDEPVTRRAIVERKRADVTEISEGTLIAMDSERVRNVQLVGRNIARPLALVSCWAGHLRMGKPNAPVFVVFAGAPATGKSDLACVLARMGGVPAYELVSPKDSLVGRTEARAHLQQETLQRFSPGLGYIDEFTEAFPSERSGQNLDSGASAAVSAEMLKALGDTSRAGRSMIIGATNCPWKMGSALRSRGQIVPILQPLREDYPPILAAILSRLEPSVVWDPCDPGLSETAWVFYEKGCTPRAMEAALTVVRGLADEALSPILVHEAADGALEASSHDRLIAEFADLSAIGLCPHQRFLPWSGQVADYPFPPYLSAIVHSTTGAVSKDKLQQRLADIRSALGGTINI